MATADYAELEPARRSLNIRGADDIHDDDLIETARLAAARAVDELCNRPTGFAPDADVSTRVYRSTGGVVFLDDVASLDGFTVAAYESAGVWTLDTEFDTEISLEPYNSLADGKPFTMMTGCWSASRVQVTAKWGWPTVPKPIIQATQLLVQRLFSRKDSPAGVAGWDAMGSAVRVGAQDPDVRMLLAPYVRPTLP